jgi:hypothetical protein
METLCLQQKKMYSVCVCVHARTQSYGLGDFDYVSGLINWKQQSLANYVSANHNIWFSVSEDFNL